MAQTMNAYMLWGYSAVDIMRFKAWDTQYCERWSIDEQMVMF